MQFSYFTGGITNTFLNSAITVEQAVEIIRSTLFKDRIEEIRRTEKQREQDNLKKKLDYFTFSGEFKERKEDGLIKHSGFICIDFDDLQQLVYIREKLIKDPFTHLLFTSPTGTGLKVVVKIDPENHIGAYFWLEGYYDRTYGLKIDEKCKDVPRACFVSWDPECFYNAESLSPEMPSEELKLDYSTGELLEEREKLPEDKEKQKKVVIAYIKKLESMKKDITADYKDWVDIAFCFSVFGEDGRELFHRVSKLNEKYKPQDADYKFTNAIKTSRFKTPAKFFAICKTYGVTIQRIRQAGAARAEGVAVDYDSEWEYKANRTTLDLDESQKKSVHKYRVVEVGAMYYEVDKFHVEIKEVTLKAFSNFIIRPLFLVTSKTDSKRVIEIENIYGVRKAVDIPTDAFTSKTDFDKFIERQGNFLFTVKSPPFTLLKVKIYEQTMEAEEVKTLGWHRDAQAFFWANGAYKDGKFFPINDYGIVTLSSETMEDGEPKVKKRHFFLPAMSDIYREADDMYETEKRFIFIKRPDVTFKDWSAQFYRTHSENGILGMTFYISALFSDFIYGKLKFFPHLFLFGVPRSGKSTMGWSISYMFGIAQNPFQLNAGTHVGLARLLASFRNGIIWEDEYNNNDIDDKKYQLLKGAYDRTGHTKGLMDNSNKTTTTPTNSSSVISGQQLPTRDNGALFTRTILLPFNKTEFTEEERDNLRKLQEIEQKGLSHITSHISTFFRKKVEENFMAEFEATIKEFQPLLEGINDSRIVQNTMVPVTIYKLTADKLVYPFTYLELKTFAAKAIRDQYRLISHSKETSVFWDMMMFMLAQNMIKEKEDYVVKPLNFIRVTKGGESKEVALDETTRVLYLRMAKVHPLYMKLHREQTGKVGMDKNSLLHYLQNLACYLGSNDSFRFGEYVTSCYIFNADMLTKDGYDFERHIEDLTKPEDPKKPEQSKIPKEKKSGKNEDKKAKEDASDMPQESDGEDLPF
jgi:hypothetical protein